MKKTKLSERWELEEDGYSIVVDKHENSYCVFNEVGKDDFVFQGSSSETLETIGRLLIEASKL